MTHNTVLEQSADHPRSTQSDDPFDQANMNEEDAYSDSVDENDAEDVVLLSGPGSPEPEASAQWSFISRVQTVELLKVQLPPLCSGGDNHFQVPCNASRPAAKSGVFLLSVGFGGPSNWPLRKASRWARKACFGFTWVATRRMPHPSAKWKRRLLPRMPRSPN